MSNQVEGTQVVSIENPQTEDKPLISNSLFALLVLCSMIAGAVAAVGIIFLTSGT